MTVSVIVPVYNVQDYVIECLESVKGQSTVYQIECIIVDDCSSDTSLELIQSYLKEYRGKIDFKLIVLKKNGGQAAARNIGIKHATGDYIFFLDSDDILPEFAISDLINLAIKFPEADWIQGDIETFPISGLHLTESIRNSNFPEYTNDLVWIRKNYLNKFPTSPWSKLVRRSFILNNNLFFKEGIVHEDSHWHYKAYAYVNSLAFVEKVTYLYRIREGSTMRQPNFERRQFEMLYIIYQDLLANNKVVDRNWIEWSMNSLNRIRSFKSKDDYKDTAKKYLSNLVSIIRHNHSYPWSIRVLCIYFTFPYFLFTERIFYKILHKLLDCIYR